MTNSSTDPALSVVVVSISPVESLTACLEVLAADTQSTSVETLVVRDCRRLEPSAIAGLAVQFANVRWVEAPPGSTVPRMRSLGFQQCRADIVALIEDDCLVERGWSRAIVAAHRTRDVAVGGAVEPGPYRRALDWAVYFCDYAPFMLPFAGGPATALPGNNTSFKRTALAALPAAVGAEFTEFEAHRTWRRASASMRAEPAVRVRNIHSWTIDDVTRLAYHHGRAFAGRRLADRSRSYRLFIAAGCAVLPIVKVVRVVREAVSRRRFVGRLIQALPWIIVFATSWSIGEATGALYGPGDSASAWR